MAGRRSSSLEERPDPTPGPGLAPGRVAGAGVNFIDTYRRAGVVSDEVPPTWWVVEGAGTVLWRFGDDVTGLRRG